MENGSDLERRGRDDSRVSAIMSSSDLLRTGVGDKLRGGWREWLGVGGVFGKAGVGGVLPWVNASVKAETTEPPSSRWKSTEGRKCDI
jgi:hypothetical protein